MARHVDDMAFIYSCYSQSNNHTPAMLEMNSGMFLQGRPCVGSWVTYGLGSENRNLPGFVVLHGAMPRGGKPIWSPGFLAEDLSAHLDRRPQQHADRESGPDCQGHDRCTTTGPAGHVLKGELNRQHQQTAAARSGPGRQVGVLRAGVSDANRGTGKRWTSTRNHPRHISAYGVDQKETQLVAKQCIIARRLVERRCAIRPAVCRYERRWWRSCRRTLGWPRGYWREPSNRSQECRSADRRSAGGS